MPAEAIEMTQKPASSHKSSFFRQSGWMMITAVGGGALMFAVQVIAAGILKSDEYSAFVTLVQLTNWMMIPSLGLQMVFSQQTAAAIAEHQRQQLVSTMKSVLLWTFCIWILMAVVTIGGLGHWVAMLKLKDSTSLLLTLVVGFAMLWQPIFQGLLQGRQNFLWLGWVAVFNGCGRLMIGGFIVLALHGQAAGLMAGVLIGLILAVGTAAWQNLDLWREPGAKFDARGWLGRVVPLTLGFGSSTFIFSADAIVVQNFLGGSNAAGYMFGSTLCRAIVLFTAPLAAVMFPKLVQSKATSQKTDLMGLTLLVTGGLCCVAVAGLWLTSPFIFHAIKKDPTGEMLKLMPTFAFGMALLGTGNVLLYNLMAHSRFKIVPVVVALAVGYWIALQHFHESFRQVILTFDLVTVIYLGICVLFNWVLDKDTHVATKS